MTFFRIIYSKRFMAQFCGHIYLVKRKDDIRMSNKSRDNSNYNSRGRSGSGSGSRDNSFGRPTYAADVSNGYVQSQNGSLFIGKTVDLCFGSRNRAYFVVHNPEGSGVNMVLNSIDASNLGSVPMRINAYTNAKISVRGQLIESDNVAAANTDYSGTNPEGAIYYGRGVRVLSGKAINTAVVNGYQTSTTSIGGGMIVTPGNTMVFELSSLSDCDKARALISLEWWEE